MSSGEAQDKLGFVRFNGQITHAIVADVDSKIYAYDYWYDSRLVAYRIDQVAAGIIEFWVVRKK